MSSGQAHFEANQDSYSNLAKTIQPTDFMYEVGKDSSQSCWSTLLKDTTTSFCLRAPEGYTVNAIGASTIVTGIYFSCRAGGSTNVDTEKYDCPYDGQNLVGVGYMDGGSIYLCMP